ncbi:hypothetical protein D3C77_463120 [compost metagenome]
MQGSGKGLIEQQGASQLRNTRRRLDAIAALGRQPEERRVVRVSTNHQIAVGDEGTQTGPGVAGAANGQGSQGFDVVDADRYIELLGHHILRCHRIGIGRRAEQLPGIGFEIETLVHPDDCRPLRERLVWRPFEGKGTAPTRLQANGLHATQRGDLIGPGACGVDQLTRLNRAAIGQAYLPEAIGQIRLDQLGIAAQRAARLAKAT